VRTELRAKGSSVHLTMVQLPGLNTPQFEHARAKMPNVPMPVPPVFQPEVAAGAVHFAAHKRRREVWVGVPTIYTILGNKIAPGIAERYLARTGIKSQQTGKPLGEDVRPGNLFDPPARDEGAHGPYDDMAHGHSVQLLATKHRVALGAAVAGAAGLAALGATRAAANGNGHRARRLGRMQELIGGG
jgi:hypothetical protein